MHTLTRKNTLAFIKITFLLCPTDVTQMKIMIQIEQQCHTCSSQDKSIVHEEMNMKGIAITTVYCQTRILTQGEEQYRFSFSPQDRVQLKNTVADMFQSRPMTSTVMISQLIPPRLPFPSDSTLWGFSRHQENWSVGGHA
uniref:Putative secreted protein n=1 Tax=Amblyomma triste TaxID=251400 RepID=A0A023G4T0_AMBTT